MNFSKWSASERLFAMHVDMEHALILRVSQHAEHIPPSTGGLGVRPAGLRVWGLPVSTLQKPIGACVRACTHAHGWETMSKVGGHQDARFTLKQWPYKVACELRFLLISDLHCILADFMLAPNRSVDRTLIKTHLNLPFWFVVFLKALYVRIILCLLEDFLLISERLGI